MGTETYPHVNRINHEMRHGGRVVVMSDGGADEPRTDTFEHDPRVMFITNRSLRGTDIPTNTRVIIATRKVSHAAKRKASQFVAKHRVPFFDDLKTGDIRAMLIDALSNANGNGNGHSEVELHVEPEPAKPPEPPSFWGDEKPNLTGFLQRRFPKHTIFASRLTDEDALHLVTVAAAHGVSTTKASLRNTYYKMRKDLKADMIRRASVDAPPAPAPVATATTTSTQIALSPDSAATLDDLRTLFTKAQELFDACGGMCSKMEAVLAETDRLRAIEKRYLAAKEHFDLAGG